MFPLCWLHLHIYFFFISQTETFEQPALGFAGGSSAGCSEVTCDQCGIQWRSQGGGGGERQHGEQRDHSQGGHSKAGLLRKAGFTSGHR